MTRTTALVIALSLPARVALADEEPPLVPPTEPPAARDEGKAEPAPDPAAARFEKLETELAQLREQVAASQIEQPERKLLSFWGFMDTSFGGIHYDDRNALYRIQTPATATFFSSGVNLYAKSEMTRTLSALVEVRLTYSPAGYANGWPVTARVGNDVIAKFGQASRVDTSARGPYSQLEYQQSGLLIERAHVDWRPEDWFGLRVGRFLTPFGIWNEDHGSPVLLGVDAPQLMNFGLVPIWQLGAQAFGSIGGGATHLEYAATLTNTRGPYDSYKDTTDFKALGARLKLVHEAESFKLRIGGYAYVNHYREVDDQLFLNLTPALTLDSKAKPGFGSTEVETTAYDETVITGDVEVRVRRLRVFGEAVHRTIDYQVPSKVGDEDKMLLGVPFTTTLYDASHYGWAFYVLGAYEIPVHTRFANLTVTPYAGYDYVVPSTTIPTKTNTQIRGGLNVKPSPYVTLKLEGMRLLPKSDAVASEGTALMSQLAVSF